MSPMDVSMEITIASLSLFAAELYCSSVKSKIVGAARGTYLLIKDLSDFLVVVLGIVHFVSVSPIKSIYI